MEFGKLANISNIDFRLPPLDQQCLQRIKSSNATSGSSGGRQRVWVGCPAWGHKEWVGSIYPPKTPAKDFLYHYSRQFHSIELNTTYYRIPTPENVLAWKRIAPPEFKFCPKFTQLISHDFALVGAEEPARLFCDSVQHFGENLGISFLQLAPHFAPPRLPVLGNFLKSLPRGFKVAVEFRHRDWFKNGQGQALARETTDLLAAFGASTVITDVAGRRDVSHASLSGPSVMIRFVGNELHPSDFERADAWVERIGVWLSHGVNEIYLMVHQPNDLLGPALVAYCIDKLNSRLGLELPRWKDYSVSSDPQLSLLG